MIYSVPQPIYNLKFNQFYQKVSEKKKDDAQWHRDGMGPNSRAGYGILNEIERRNEEEEPGKFLSLVRNNF